MPLTAVFADLDRALRDGEARRHQPLPTGFAELDRAISGGIRTGELVLIGGAEGIGKTTMALQMARNMAAGGSRVLYVCYEHDERYLLTRLLAMELSEPSEEKYESAFRMQDVITRIERAGTQKAGMQVLLEGTPELARAAAKLQTYADRLLLLRGTPADADLTALSREVTALLNDDPATPCVLFIDYLQKVPVHPDPSDEAERATRVVEGLKDLALNLKLPVIAIVAAEKAGLQAPRLRSHHLRGGSALLYDADIILILNEKHRILTKQYLTFNEHQARAFHAWVVCSIEKNRSGRHDIDLEFRKRFEYARFDPDGRSVIETLIDERIEHV
jgi:replicative DNA helicase